MHIRILQKINNAHTTMGGATHIIILLTLDVWYICCLYEMCMYRRGGSGSSWLGGRERLCNASQEIKRYTCIFRPGCIILTMMIMQSQKVKALACLVYAIVCGTSAIWDSCIKLLQYFVCYCACMHNHRFECGLVLVPAWACACVRIL